MSKIKKQKLSDLKNIELYLAKCRAVKMGSNLQANLTHYRFRVGWIEIFLQILIQIKF